MEKEKILKRAREGEEGENQTKVASDQNDTKRQDLHGLNFSKENNVREGNPSKAIDSSLALGVFDFPWLKDGGVSKYDEYDCHLNIEDSFLSSFEVKDTNFKDAGVHLFAEQCFYDTPEKSLVHFSEELEDNVWLPFEKDGLEFSSEDVDCSYSYTATS